MNREIIACKNASGQKSANGPHKRVCLLVLTVFLCFSSVFAQESAGGAIDVNLIIDGSSDFTAVKGEVSSWLDTRLGQILKTGDRITVWNAGPSARVIFTGTISESGDLANVKNAILDIQGSGSRADFAGALSDASQRRGEGLFTYTLLISASPDALSNTISGPQAAFLRFSRVEEFSTWRALVIGLNLESRVRNAAAAFYSR